MSEIQMSEIQTKFCSVFQTERSDFGHLLYSGMQKYERLKSEQCRNTNFFVFGYTHVGLRIFGLVRTPYIVGFRHL